MFKSLQDFIAESLDKHYTFTQNTKVANYIYGQYEFEHGGTTLVVRFQNGAQYGKRVSVIKFGRRAGTKVSKKLPPIGNIRPVLATVVAIIKYHIANTNHPGGKKRLHGFALELDAEDHGKLVDMAGLILRRIFKEYKAFKGIDANMSNASDKTIYLARRGRKFDQLFTAVELPYEDPEDDEEDDDAYAASTMSYDDDMQDNDYDLTKAKPDKSGIIKLGISKLKNEEPPVEDDEIGLDDFDPEDLASMQAVLDGDTDLLATFTTPPKDKYPPGYYTDNHQNIFLILADTGTSYQKSYSVLVRDKSDGELEKMSFSETSLDLMKLSMIPVGVKGIQMNVANQNLVVAYQIIGSDDIHIFSGMSTTKLPVTNSTVESLGITPQNEKNEYPFEEHNVPFAINVDAATGEFLRLRSVTMSDLEALNDVILDPTIKKNKGFLLQPTKTVLKNMVTHDHEVYSNADSDVKQAVQDFLGGNVLDSLLDEPKQPDTDKKEEDFNKEIQSDFKPKPEPVYKGYPEGFSFKKHNLSELKGGSDIRWGRYGSDPERKIDLGYGISFDLKTSLTDMRNLFRGFQNLSGADSDNMKKVIRKYITEKELGATKVIKDVFDAQHSTPSLKLSGSSITSIERYTGSEYIAMNNRLRDPNAPTFGSTDEHIENLDRAFSEAGLVFPKGVTVYRGESKSDDEIAELRAGREVFNHSYSSTSLKPTIATSFTRAVHEIPAIMGFGDDSDFSVERNYKRNKLVMSLDGLEKIPVLVPGEYSNFDNEAEVILPRGVKFKLASDDLFEPHPRVWIGHFTVTGIQGLDTLFESNTFQSFRMFTEQTTNTELKVKTMLFDMMAMDYVWEDYVKTDEELENMQEYFRRMMHEG